MARSVSGGAPPPSRAPEGHFNPLRRNDLQDPPLSVGASAPPPVRDQGARQQPARTGRGPSPARCGSVTTHPDARTGIYGSKGSPASPGNVVTSAIAKLTII